MLCYAMEVGVAKLAAGLCTQHGCDKASPLSAADLSWRVAQLRAAGVRSIAIWEAPISAA